MRHILMVDDVSTNLKCATEVLNDIYEITTAKSGKQALMLLKEITPDLILLDINMPVMNGYEVMDKIKENPELSGIPIIFLTAENDRETEAKGLKMGATDFIKKPFEPDVIRSRIEKAIRMKEHNKELLDIAQKDSLTNLLNRRYMEKFLNENFEMNGFFLLLDMDNFKQVNDTFGHIVGDDVLVRFSRVMEEETSSKDCVCRIGGDEFAVFIKDEADENRIKSIARRMIAGVEFEVNNLLADNCEFKVSVSVGIAKRPDDGKEFNELYSCADKALYYVKQNGKRGYHFFCGANDNKDSVYENSQIDLLQLQRLVQEKEDSSGAFKVEYNGFKRIYHFVARCMERTQQDIQLVLFTMNNENAEKTDFTEAEKAMPVLEEAIAHSLRRGDVATKCGAVQYVVILMNASYENGNMVARRIVKKFGELTGDGGLTLSYEMQSVEAKKEDE